jgi:hypothetical protein
MKTTRLAFVAAALGFSALPFSTACSSSGSGASPVTEETASTGEISAALFAVGPDGATYTLPAYTDFVITRVGSAFGTCRSYLGSNATQTQTLSFPAGTYTVGLSSSCTLPDAGGDGGATGVPFTLNRAGDGGASTVSAVLQNPVQTVTIASGGTTPIVFNFAIQGLGTLSFGNGSANVGIATSPSVTASPPTSGVFAGSFGPTAYADSSSGTMPALTSLFATPGTAPFNLTLKSLSAFTANLDDSICATFTAQITTGAGTPTALQALLAGELSGAQGTVCFADASSSYAQNMVAITINKMGPVSTPTFQTALANTTDGGVPSAGFLLILNAPTALVYNGSTAAFGQFSAPVTLSNTYMSVQILNGVEQQRYGFLTGNSTFSLTLSP